MLILIFVSMTIFPCIGYADTQFDDVNLLSCQNKISNCICGMISLGKYEYATKFPNSSKDKKSHNSNMKFAVRIGIEEKISENALNAVKFTNNIEHLLLNNVIEKCPLYECLITKNYIFQGLNNYLLIRQII